jgi:hypothetical protein
VKNRTTLLKIAENHANLLNIDKKAIKGNKNGAKDVCEGPFGATGQKLV